MPDPAEYALGAMLKSSRSRTFSNCYEKTPELSRSGNFFSNVSKPYMRSSGSSTTGGDYLRILVQVNPVCNRQPSIEPHGARSLS